MNEKHVMRSLCRAASVAAILALLGTAFDIVLSMVPGWGTATVPATASGWLQQMAENPLLGLRNLDALNVLISLIAAPMYIVLAWLHRRERPVSALLGLVLVLSGTMLFAAANAALPMFGLSQQWAYAGAAERLALATAAEGLLVRGAHGSMGVLPGFLLSELGTTVLALSTMSGVLISRRTAGLGAIGAAVLAVYTLLMTFGGGQEPLVLMLAAPAGIIVMVWQAAVARRLLMWSGPARPGLLEHLALRLERPDTLAHP